jgi:GT2 family glycosyltransferase
VSVGGPAADTQHRAAGGSALSDPSVSVVMPTYQRRAMLEQVIAPLLATPDALEVIVVVDGSRDGSLELLEQIARGDPRLRPLFIENQGMVQARLHGARAARGDVVLLLDDDVELEPGAIEAHARVHRNRGAIVAVGAMPVAGGGQHGPHDYPRALYAREYDRHLRAWTDDPASVLATFWEGNVSIRRSDLLALPDPALPEIGRAYHCDVDFGLRCLDAGLRGLYVADARGLHRFSRSPEQFIADARSSGRGLLLVHAAHRRQLGELREERLLGSLPGPLGRLAKLAVVRPVPRGAIAGLVEILGRAGLYRAQRRAASVLRVTEQVREVRRRRATGRPVVPAAPSPRDAPVERGVL